MNLSRRTGWMLLEMTVSIAVTSVISGLIVTLLATLFQHNQKVAHARNEAVALDGLADQFRADVRSASSIDQEDAAGTSQQIALKLAPNARVVYRIQGDRLVRIIYQAEKRSGQESYLLPEGTQLTLREAPSSVGEMATLVLDYPLSPKPESKRRHRIITAALGRNLAWDFEGKESQP